MAIRSPPNGSPASPGGNKHKDKNSSPAANSKLAKAAEPLAALGVGILAVTGLAFLPQEVMDKLKSVFSFLPEEYRGLAVGGSCCCCCSVIVLCIFMVIMLVSN